MVVYEASMLADSVNIVLVIANPLSPSCLVAPRTDWNSFCDIRAGTYDVLSASLLDDEKRKRQEGDGG
jgi:hypothetical protein